MQTSRLLLRPFQPSDVEELYQLNLDWECIKYTGDEPFKSIDEAEKFIENYKHYEKYGFGRWSVLLKETNEFLGWCGLKYSPDLDEFDIGFRFHRKHWGKGYATEAAEFCLNLGFEEFMMQEIVGRVMPENIASIKVLEKLGMKYKETQIIENQKWLIYLKKK